MRRNWITAGYAVDEWLSKITKEAALKLTHLNVAFGHVREDGISIDHLKHLDSLQVLKGYNPELTILLSVGGWGAGGFSEAAATPAGRKRMAETAALILRNHPFDGIDLDWEYPCYSEAGIVSSPDDKSNFTLLLKEIREALNLQGAAAGKHFLLTIAAGADQYYFDGTEMDRIHPYLDFIQLMTYDMRGGFQTLTGHHTNLYTPTGDLFRISADASVRLFRNAGVPADKIVIGAAFYSRMWKNVPDNNNGLHQMTTGAGGYGPDFTRLTADYIGKNGFTRHWDEEAKAPYLFDGESFISYEDEESLRYKCDYVVEQGLAGIMFWEYGCDTTRRLLSAIYSGFEERHL
ncbi:glycoside hydrolase family 18 protein [Cohnella luojiensis]|uniref:chitinase n=1 Tax=Cohnella luojiensis TaxID=652876 RepID=A0A4Y8LU82_9BACL|nr:glycoside hydrolase family 18 protein [Cohnella luojiensis]TFE25197.1 glycoside hydrolase family 18 protein [Cohnella luojiensis]